MAKDKSISSRTYKVNAINDDKIVAIARDGESFLGFALNHINIGDSITIFNLEGSWVSKEMNIIKKIENAPPNVRAKMWRDN